MPPHFCTIVRVLRMFGVRLRIRSRGTAGRDPANGTLRVKRMWQGGPYGLGANGGNRTVHSGHKK
eukprot:9490709-Pyramimonas_sp.AAC.2